MDVKLNLELVAKHLRKYPEVKVGDKVRVYKKEKTMQNKESQFGSQKTEQSNKSLNTEGNRFTKSTASITNIQEVRFY